jgi:hypothetical protein
MRRGLHLAFNLVQASEGCFNLSFKDFSVSQEVTFEDNSEPLLETTQREEEILTRHSGLTLCSLR